MAFQNYYQNGYYPQYQNGAVPDILNQYKGQYQPMMQQPMQPIQPMQQPIQSNGGLIWVDSEEQAKNYLVAPNNVVPMFDKNLSVMYLKSADGAGMPTFKKYKLVDVDEEMLQNTPKKAECNCGDKFATQEQIRALEADLERLTAMYEELANKQNNKAIKKKEVEKNGESDV